MLVCRVLMLGAVPLEDQPAFFERAHEYATRLGSGYGGWLFLPQLLTADAVVYAFGIGNDISWDLEVIRSTGCHVHAFDDTPVSNRWFKSIKERYARQNHGFSTKFHRHPYLLSTSDGPMQLDLPKGHGASWAPVTEGGAFGFSGRKHQGNGRTLATLMAMLGHQRHAPAPDRAISWPHRGVTSRDLATLTFAWSAPSRRRLDVLKMDVESAEFALFNELLLQPGFFRGPRTVPPNVLCPRPHSSRPIRTRLQLHYRPHVPVACAYSLASRPTQAQARPAADYPSASCLSSSTRASHRAASPPRLRRCSGARLSSSTIACAAKRAPHPQRPGQHPLHALGRSLTSLGFTLIHNVVQPDSADNAFLINPRFCDAGANATRWVVGGGGSSSSRDGRTGSDDSEGDARVAAAKARGAVAMAAVGSQRRAPSGDAVASGWAGVSARRVEDSETTVGKTLESWSSWIVGAWRSSSMG